MNKKLIITLIVAIVVIAVGAAAYFLMDRADNNASQNQESSPDSLTDTVADIADTSISNLLGAGIARKCTYTDQSSSGTIYLANNNRMRADFTSANSEDGNGGMIINEDRQYIWNADTKEGFVMAFTSTSDDDAPTSDDHEHDSSAVDMNQEYDFDCDLWVVDESVLAPPADVSFSDMLMPMHDHAH